MGSSIIEGGHALSGSIRPQGAKDEVLEVIRAGIALLIAVMSADGVIDNIGRIDRGYDGIDGHLNALDTMIERQY